MMTSIGNPSSMFDVKNNHVNHFPPEFLTKILGSEGFRPKFLIWNISRNKHFHRCLFLRYDHLVHCVLTDSSISDYETSTRKGRQMKKAVERTKKRLENKKVRELQKKSPKKVQNIEVAQSESETESEDLGLARRGNLSLGPLKLRSFCEVVRFGVVWVADSGWG